MSGRSVFAICQRRASVAWFGTAALLVVTAGPAAAVPIFSDDFEAGTPGQVIPQNDAPWGVNTSGLPATWESASNPFPSGSIYAYINDTSSTDGLGTRLMTTDDDSDPNGYGAQITGAVTTFSFDFYEPTDAAGDDTGTVKFGYSNADDMNSSEKSFAADLDDGVLSADNGIGDPADVPYALNTVHCIWMVANDSAAPLADYMGGQTLEAGQADVWISLDGAAPVYAFSVVRVNAGPHSAGFRSFTGNISELLIDNVRIDPGVAIPEPAGLGALAAAAVALIHRRRRRLSQRIVSSARNGIRK